MTFAEYVFWLCVLGVFYPYFGYPLLLWLLGLIARKPVAAPRGLPAADDLPSVSMIIPVHNEASRIPDKLVNTAQLQYPAERLQVLFISDGSTDQTVELIRAQGGDAVTLIELPTRRGKAAGLNAGLAAATNDILVFSDASIRLGPDALQHLVRQFADPAVGCVSGEDPIVGSGGEALYGQYELFLRRLESGIHSIVGASGSFYAQRRRICRPFTEGMAPDFLSVLRTVEQGYRAVSEPGAVGTMTSVKDPRQEFDRKVRTVLRGITTLAAYGALLDPLRFGVFAFELWSHKVMRWLAPLFMVGTFVSALVLAANPFYLLMFLGQAAFYLIAYAALREWAGVQRTLPAKIALYFSSVNAAILAGWWRFSRGVRQEIWTPSSR